MVFITIRYGGELFSLLIREIISSMSTQSLLVSRNMTFFIHNLYFFGVYFQYIFAGNESFHLFKSI